MQDLNDKVVVITGGATGIGFSFAKAFGKEGAKLILAGRREDRLKEAVSALEEQGTEATYKVCDTSDPQQVEALADFSWDWKGHVDVIMNNAGIILPTTSVIDTPFSDVEKIFSINYMGVWYGSAIFGKRMIEQGTPAAIYNLGSENSLFHGVPHGSAYVSTKHAVLALTESLREEMPDFVEVGLVCPGFVASEMIPDESRAMAMPSDQYVDVAMKQIKEGTFFIVSHAYNIERIQARFEEVSKAYSTYAPRYEGDAQYDIRTLAAMAAAQQAEAEES